MAEDQLANLREPSEEALRRFSDGEGYSPYAHRAHLRWRGLAYYLGWFALIGHAGAAAKACERYGHETRAGRCERCGQPDDPRTR